MKSKISIDFLEIVIFALFCLCRCCAVMDNKSNALMSPPATTSQLRECSSIDIRNECDKFLQLRGCTVIKGYLLIVLLPTSQTIRKEACNYTQYRFPELREITDFMIFYEVKRLKSIRELFPNITVIRGRRLFLNYALSISSMPDLEMIEFKSLTAIQRGHVYVGNCPQLCHLEKINWDRLTLSPGENHIFPNEPEKCPQKSECNGCENDFCWSNAVCQKFENDNVNNLRQGSQHCHEECLSGCTNKTNTGCVVCRHLTDHGACVSECPEGKFLHEHHQRCYTFDECVNKMGKYLHDKSCISNCPSGFKANASNYCMPCQSGSDCMKVCESQSDSDREIDLVAIYNLADADYLTGCEVINGTLLITIRNQIDEADLIRTLGSIKEIRGHLKIYKSFLTDLKFLSNLQVIRGEPLETENYAIILHGNKRLKELWKPKTQLTLMKGGIYAYSNPRLCNLYVKEFKDSITHDRDRNTIQPNDKDVMCGPAKLPVRIEIISHHELLASWPKDMTSEEVEIIYRETSDSGKLHEDDEIDDNVCTRNNWRRQLMFSSELKGNDTHFMFRINELKQNTKYAILVKTFGENYIKDARSVLQEVQTSFDIPMPPQLRVVKKTDSSLVVSIEMPKNAESYLVDYYLLMVYEKADNLKLLDQRDYCEQPDLSFNKNLVAYMSKSYEKDYDQCCAHVQLENEDKIFIDNMQERFSCSLDKKRNCFDEDLSTLKAMNNSRLQSNETTYILENLKRYQTYVLKVIACNKMGCSSHTMISERTNVSKGAEAIKDLHGCHVPKTSEYRVFFSEPEHPNGAITRYIIHYQNSTNSSNADHLKCVTRLEHEQSGYMYLAHLNGSYDQIAVRVHSLGAALLSEWVNLTVCSGPAPTLVPKTKIAGISIHSEHGHHGLNIFLACFLIGAGMTFLWILYKRRYWRQIPELRRYFPVRRNIRNPFVNDNSDEDRQILVDNYETVRFHNKPDD